ncbi:MAG: biopolymer transporter ExbD [Myxococcales bacterium]|nr:biopolymer transporter ExbD [Myxococcales bacterium]MCB9642696.1 biopolymer transporter ExbD [Myxococcales bacterium]
MFEAPRRSTPEIGLTPLIDVVFILLIFVVIAANFERIRGLKVELPTAESVQASPKKPLILTVGSRGQYQVDGRDISKKDLTVQLKQLRERHKDLVIRADSKVALQHAVFVLDLAAKLQFQSVSLAAADVKPNP